MHKYKCLYIDYIKKLKWSYNGDNCASTRHQRLTNKMPSAKEGLLILESLIRELPKTPKYHRSLPFLFTLDYLPGLDGKLLLLEKPHTRVIQYGKSSWY